MTRNIPRREFFLSLGAFALRLERLLQVSSPRQPLKSSAHPALQQPQNLNPNPSSK